MASKKKDASLDLPRILCLHGGGVNADIFGLQARGLNTRLASLFRLVFVDAPYECAAHPSIAQIFDGFGPFRRWLRWTPDHPAIDDETAAAEIWGRLRSTMDEDEGTGEWVGILGFSQGAKIAASLLWAQEKMEEAGDQVPLTSFRFGVIMAGRAPVVRLDMRISPTQNVDEAGGMSMNFGDWPETNKGEHVLSLPTLHVHGLQDPGLEYHRTLLELYCKPGTTKLVEWDGDHRLPIKAADVEAVVAKLLVMAKETGVVVKA